MEIFWAIVAFAGPIVLLGGFIAFMVKKKGWAWNQAITSGIFALLVASAVPDLPEAVNNGVMGIIEAFTNNK